MRIRKQIVEHVQAGNLKVSIDYDAAGRVDDVAVEMKDAHGFSTTRFSAPAELVERVATILQTRRLATGHDAYVCGVCGYVEEHHDCEKEAKEAIR